MNNNLTFPYLTKYEQARILGIRANQISQNSPVFVKTYGIQDSFEIACKELKEGKLPIKILRKLPNGHIEIFNVKTMSVNNDLLGPS